MSGRKLALIVILGAGLIALLRMVFVPVGSFRAGLDRLAFGMPADSVREVLGNPNAICTAPTVDHLEIQARDTAMARQALRAATAERWVYSRSRPDEQVPREPRPDCRAPFMASELGFDAAGRLRWYVREMQQTRAVVDTTLFAH
jgi:hypothetical protein